jgi:hypothetical protein
MHRVQWVDKRAVTPDDLDPLNLRIGADIPQLPTKLNIQQVRRQHITAA